MHISSGDTDERAHDGAVSPEVSLAVLQGGARHTRQEAVSAGDRPDERHHSAM